jgi:drug/metabolite transporter (DMT)-like permease
MGLVEQGESSRGRGGRARGVAYALVSAILFGGSTPFVRPALDRVNPVAGAGWLYLGQALVLSSIWLAGRAARGRREAPIGRGDLGPLIGGIVAGGLVAPGAFLCGLARVPAHQASLLLGLEIVFTLLLAIVFRRERLAPRGWAGAGMLLVAGILVSAPNAPEPGAPGASEAGLSLAGVLLIVVACLGWAIDNNLTAGISGKDPTAISLLKGWAGGIAYLGGCVLFGRSIAAPPSDLLTLLLAGAIGYGLALRLFIYALRHIGAALTTTIFSTAPIVGFALSVLLLGESPAAAGWAAFALAGIGVAIVATDGRAPGLTMEPGTGHQT